MSNDEAEHIGALRAERHANADFVGPLHDEERHHAVNADRSEDEGDRGEDSTGAHREPPRRDGVGDHLFSVRTCAIGSGGINRLHLLRRALVRLVGSCELRTARMIEGYGACSKRHVEFRFYGLIESAVMESPTIPTMVAQTGPSRVGNWIRLPSASSLGQYVVREGAVDDDDRRGVELVGAVEEAAL